MSKEKLILKNTDYDGYIYYNGKRNENTKEAKLVKKKKVDYYVLLEDDSFYSEFCVSKKDNIILFNYFEKSFTKNPEFIMKELSKKYDVVNINSIGLHITDNEQILKYLKEHFQVLDENIDREDELFQNGKNITYVNLTIKLR